MRTTPRRVDIGATTTSSHHKENLMSFSDPGSPAIATSPKPAVDRSMPVTTNPATAVFGQVMGLVAVTIGFLAVGAYVGGDLYGGLGIVFLIAAFACVFGDSAHRLRVRAHRG
jgi:hypothetical protein